jgi:phosphoribosylformylglycinamidine (FGAM) synthase-like amidotransferase family enzyme
MKKIKLFEEFNANAKLKIGLYHDNGVVDSTISAWDDFFETYLGVEPVKLDSDSFELKNFEKLDLLIIPGGDSFQERLGMKEQSTIELKQWVKAGGKLLAVCAGFHLISHGHDWSLKMINVKSSNANMPEPAYMPMHRVTDDKVLVEFEITTTGKDIFSTSRNSVTLDYHGGPIGEPLDKNINVILKFKEGVPMQLPGENYSIGKIAGVFSAYGKGNIIALSPHIEKTTEERGLLSNAIDFLLNI